MKEHTFTVRREQGDFKTGDTRKLTAVDAVHLVRAKALVPKGKEAEDAMAALMKDVPDDTSGIVQAVKTDAPNNKDAGNAPRNKAGGGRAGAGTSTRAGASGSGDAGKGGQADATGGNQGGDPGTGGASGEQGGGGGEGQGGGGDTSNGGDGSQGSTTGGAAGAPPAGKPAGKRR